MAKKQNTTTRVGQRVHPISVLYDSDEYRLVRAVARREGISMSAYLRSLSFADLKRRGIEAVPDEEFDDEGDDEDDTKP